MRKEPKKKQKSLELLRLENRQGKEKKMFTLEAVQNLNSFFYEITRKGIKKVTECMGFL